MEANTITHQTSFSSCTQKIQITNTKTINITSWASEDVTGSVGHVVRCYHTISIGRNGLLGIFFVNSIHMIFTEFNWIATHSPCVRAMGHGRKRTRNPKAVQVY